jgi:hypothetical protein
MFVMKRVLRKGRYLCLGRCTGFLTASKREGGVWRVALERVKKPLYEHSSAYRYLQFIQLLFVNSLGIAHKF